MAASTGDGGGVTHRAMAPWPLLRQGSPGAMASLSRWGLALQRRRGTANSPKGVLGGSGDRSSVRDGGVLLPQGRRRWERPLVELWLIQDHEQLPLGLLKILLGFNYSERQRKLVRDSGGQRWRLSLGPKSTWYRALFIRFLDRIIDNKNSNSFLIWIELYLAKIWKKSRRGWIRFRNQNWTQTRVNRVRRVKAKTLSGIGSGSRVRSVQVW
jgi:hypothetical protein